MEHLKSKLVALKEMLEAMQDDLNIDYQVNNSLKKEIDMCSEAIDMCDIKPLHSTPIDGNQLMASPEV